MGTRHLTIIKHGDHLFGQYGQWDGYPEGQGLAVWDFIKERLDLAKFKRQFAKARLLTKEEIKAKWTEAGADPKSDFVTMDVGKVFGKMFPALSRDTGAEVLKYIQEVEGAPELDDQISFAAESLFCEFGWMLDLDAKVLRVFKGFNTEPLPKGEFFKYLEKEKPPKEKGSGETYYPIKLWHEIPFAKLKAMSKKQFLASFPKDPRDEDESVLPANGK